MNLLQDQWITVQRRKGQIEKIAPYQITDGINTDNPIVEIITPRPDFKGALYQFFIGLFQTVYAPKDETEWEDRFNEPPSPEDLKKETDKIAFAFDLFGEKIRFMQDVSIRDEKKEDLKWLLLDCNEDFFNKRDNVINVCIECSTLALLTAQIYSPAGGRGHRTSIRGGGPLTTILRTGESYDQRSLWKDIYLNVMPDKNINPTQLKKLFLWIDNDYLLSVLESSITNSDSEKLHFYWAMPKRIFFSDEDLSENYNCDICGHNNKTIAKYIIKSQGCNYDKTWIHYLSPYRKDQNEVLHFLCKHNSHLYNHWNSYIFNTKSTFPAKVINYFNENRKIATEQTIIQGFGYYVDNAKTICWYESLIPIYRIETKYIEKYEAMISSILGAATQVANNLQTKVKDAWFHEGAKPRGDFDYLKIEFFKATEANFYSLAKSIRENLEKENPFDDNSKLEWLKYLNEESLKIFDLYVESGSIEFENIQRIVDARQGIKPSQNGKPAKIGLIPSNFNNHIKKLVGLSIIEKASAQKKQTTKQGVKKK